MLFRMSENLRTLQRVDQFSAAFPRLFLLRQVQQTERTLLDNRQKNGFRKVEPVSNSSM